MIRLVSLLIDAIFFAACVAVLGAWFFGVLPALLQEAAR